MALGRRGHPKRAMPSAIAPLETNTICLPCLCSSAICCDHSVTAFMSIPRPSLVTSDEPTFTTIRCAVETTDLELDDSGMLAKQTKKVEQENSAECPCVRR